MNLLALVPQGLFVLTHLAMAAGVAGLAFVFGCGLTSAVRWNSRSERAVVATTVGLGGLGQVLFLLGLAGWLRPLPVAAVLLGVLAVSYGVWRAKSRAWSPPRCDNPQALRQVALIVVPVALPILLLPLYPPTSFDATMYHLPYAKPSRPQALCRSFAISGSRSFPSSTSFSLPGRCSWGMTSVPNCSRRPQPC